MNYFKSLGSDALGMLLLAALALGAGLLVNHLRRQPLPLVYTTKQQRLELAVAHTARSPAPSALPAAKPVMIDLAEFRQLIEGGKAVILDARPRVFYRFGHVPGAISLSREEFENDYAKNKSLLARRKDDVIAVYCSGDSCEDSGMVADALLKLGFLNVKVYKGGWDEWSGAGLPQEGRQ
jgi:rhodanese-related sulfurtransferase